VYSGRLRVGRQLRGRGRSDQPIPHHPSYNPCTIDDGGTTNPRPDSAPTAPLACADRQSAGRVARQSWALGIASRRAQRPRTDTPIGDIQRKPSVELDAAGWPGNRRKIHRRHNQRVMTNAPRFGGTGSSTSCKPKVLKDFGRESPRWAEA
jgi:hypothetical protein